MFIYGFIIKYLLLINYVYAWHSVGYMEEKSDEGLVLAHQEL